MPEGNRDGSPKFGEGPQRTSSPPPVGAEGGEKGAFEVDPRVRDAPPVCGAAGYDSGMGHTLPPEDGSSLSYAWPGDTTRITGSFQGPVMTAMGASGGPFEPPRGPEQPGHPEIWSRVLHHGPNLGPGPLNHQPWTGLPTNTPPRPTGARPRTDRSRGPNQPGIHPGHDPLTGTSEHFQGGRGPPHHYATPTVNEPSGSETTTIAGIPGRNSRPLVVCVSGTPTTNMRFGKKLCVGPKD
ncbi:acidic proline-rich protein PRP33-like [Venturia canescens]|uniref:acidic proline-rich protein PRP33-like n=1 Tax=Venturia canescens TaxID=32260 RepID=UPI001C9D2928|nr:acidic proline-rich protein PRP33-like [Venturia canescens]XP_043285737.1 acidic proline-rich protein PRP33-like [Venturia canescens]